MAPVEAAPAGDQARHRPEEHRRAPPESTCPTITAGPASPGRGPGAYQPARSTPGTSIVRPGPARPARSGGGRQTDPASPGPLGSGVDRAHRAGPDSACWRRATATTSRASRRAAATRARPARAWEGPAAAEAGVHALGGRDRDVAGRVGILGRVRGVGVGGRVDEVAGTLAGRLGRQRRLGVPGRVGDVAGAPRGRVGRLGRLRVAAGVGELAAGVGRLGRGVGGGGREHGRRHGQPQGRGQRPPVEAGRGPPAAGPGAVGPGRAPRAGAGLSGGGGRGGARDGGPVGHGDLLVRRAVAGRRPRGRRPLQVSGETFLRAGEDAHRGARGRGGVAPVVAGDDLPGDDAGSRRRAQPGEPAAVPLRHRDLLAAPAEGHRGKR